MGRRLTGSSWERGGRFYASLPVRRESKRRIQAAFESEADRDAWVRAGVAALSAGGAAPEPERFRRGRVLVSVPADERPMPVFEALAYGWLDEYYGRLRRGNAERERDVRAIVETHLIPAFAGPIPADATLARERLVDFVRRLAAEPEWHDGPVEERAGHGRLLTISEAKVFCARSEATIRRALRDGRLPGARRGVQGEWLIPASDLVSAGVGAASRAPRAMSRAYVTDMLWAHSKILDWGRANGWQIADFARDVHALSPDETVARKRPEAELRRPLSVAELARVAAHLHVVHQLVLWLMRILGLRISEAFGPRVGDIVDLGEVGLLFVERQGGRAFITRTRGGVETTYSKRTLKRAASFRVIVVPATLMETVRVVVEAFHTDPDTGVVDLDARLVPWIVKEGRGQSAFRAALDAALVREGFDPDTCGFEVTTHDLRKSLATDLAWNPDLDELAKRRVMGHKAGDDVFARIYTLDHPTLAPLAAVARAVEATIAQSAPTLMVATERAVRWSVDNPLRARALHVDAVLAEAGWQVDRGGADNPWCDTNRVASELAVSPTTARRWMRDQVVPATTYTDEHGNECRRARLADVQAVKERLGGRILLRDLARDLGVGYHRAWYTLKRLGIDPSRDPRTEELVLSADQAIAIRAEFARLATLGSRSVRLSAAATRLGIAVGQVRELIRRGELVEDPERDAFGARYVTLASLEAIRLARGGAAPPAIGADVVSLATLVELTGLTQPQVVELTDRGLLERRDISRRFHVTVESLRRWARGYRPDLLCRLGDEPAEHPAEDVRMA
ncbi:MAG: hypothetical protein M3Q48_11805 [Actinomycetota bacterium]|nr:hypothetical protein [Actinomycetota bacterium]